MRVEEYPKSLERPGLRGAAVGPRQPHSSFAGLPMSHPAAQIKHILCSLYAYIKLEGLRMGHQVNYYTLCLSLYISPLEGSWAEL